MNNLSPNDTKHGLVEIKITGQRGNMPLTPDNYDIRDIKDILENAENLLYPDERRNRPLINYEIQKSSVKHIFRTKMQAVIAFNAIINAIQHQNNIDFLNPTTAQAFQNIQELAKKSDYEINIKAISLAANSAELKINKDTSFYRTEPIWIDAEFYFYGKITNAGGKDKANIHLNTEDLGIIKIKTPIEFLTEYEENILYKDAGIRAIGKQQLESGEINFGSLEFKELIDYNPAYDEEYLESLRAKAKSWITEIDPVAFMDEVRGRV